eukprot:6270809-Amphidinium_carterae.1
MHGARASQSLFIGLDPATCMVPRAVEFKLQRTLLVRPPPVLDSTNRSEMPSTIVSKCEVTESQISDLVKDHWVALSQLKFNLPTTMKLELASPFLIALSRLTSRLNKKPMTSGLNHAAMSIRQQPRGIDLILMQLWQHLLNKNRNKEATHSLNLHYVESTCIDNWALLDQKPKPMEECKMELKHEEICASPSTKPQVKLPDPPVKVEFIPPQS